MSRRRSITPLSFLLSACLAAAPASGGDPIRDLQERAIDRGQSEAAHWGWQPENYSLWGTHSNRLIPVYTYGTANAGAGLDLNDYTGENSLYRDPAKLIRLYGRPPVETYNTEAEYLDQTNLYDLQRAALDAGKKHIFLVVFDGMDWQTTRAAATYNTGRVAYTSGRGTGLHFQDYDANGTSQYGFMVTSPHNDGTDVDVDEQRVLNPGGSTPGGYDPNRAGADPWTPAEGLESPEYLVSGPKAASVKHAYTDSASSAVSMTAGLKTYNNAIGVDAEGRQVETIAHMAQREGYAVGAVSSVPISHATPAAAYAHNVHRNDYQDLTRDLLGLPSISHPERPLPGLDVLIGGGYGTDRDEDDGQGENYVPGNPYLTAEDRRQVDVENGGRYVVAYRTPGVNGAERLAEAADEAASGSKRLLGFYGAEPGGGHLPYRTADGGYDPTVGRKKTAEEYSSRDLMENPTLAQMTRAALTALEGDPEGFWLLVEAGDVDWANHDNNLDNSIGAVNSGDAAVKVVTDWVEQNSNWQESVMIVTADHGHYLVLDRPELLTTQSESAEDAETESAGAE
ncbi:alkaline phosphatase [Alienimonas chondri]|nr:alkaline phosphatase [Alienimonas chondri]